MSSVVINPTENEVCTVYFYWMAREVGGRNRESTDYSGLSSQIIQAPLAYLLEIPGKDVRSKMINAFNAWIQISDEKLVMIKRIIELLHTASLLYVYQ